MNRIKIDLPQPSPLILNNDSTFIIQPIVENIDMPGYEFVMTLKLYYKDKMPKAITFKKGDPLETYCSDSTTITLYPKTQQPIVVGSTKRMSCKILAIFNINKQQNNILKSYPLDSVKVYNYVTDNKYILPISDKAYFNRLITRYNHWR
jgi:virulence-associated protein VagC